MLRRANWTASSSMPGISAFSIFSRSPFKLAKLRCRLRYQRRSSSPVADPVVMGLAWRACKISFLYVHSTSCGGPKKVSAFTARPNTAETSGFSRGGFPLNLGGRGSTRTPPGAGLNALSLSAGLWEMIPPDFLLRIHRSGSTVPSTRPWFSP